MAEEQEFKEKLVVHKFLNLKDIEIETNKFNIIIGPNAQGKSNLLKLLNYFKMALNTILFELYKNKDENVDLIINGNFQYIFEDIFSFSLFKDEKFHIEYIIDVENKIKILKKNSNDFQTILSDSLKNKFLKLSKVYNSLDKLEFFNLLDALETEKNKIFNNGNRFSSWFIPEARLNFYFLKDIIFNIIAYNKNMKEKLGFIYQNFLSNFERNNNIFFDEELSIVNVDSRNIKEIIKEILKAEYIKVGSSKFALKLENDKIIQILDSSSMQREILPIIISLAVNLAKSKNISFNYFIEEPETHLYPATQKDLVEFFAMVYNQTDRETRYFITTHSPYILTSLNNLIKADNVFKAKPDKEKEIEKVVDRDKWVSFDDVSAYFLEDGKLSDIMDYEYKQIKAEEIDRISDIIMEDYDKLLDIEYGEE